ncbi:MAG: M48 family metallopeptidase [Candidatus Marinimicrobia bacterium]|nr:M48 family metallopeptidase [Candidatus Neomarinimicrobiota bacterium]MDD5709658.1 M48 family metallopeptidase [Candidatus Neomarinimicrobiota bacterium]
MPDIHPFLNPEQQTRARDYEIQKRRIALTQQIFSALITLVFILFFSLPLLQILPENPFWRFLFFIWIFLLVPLPAELYFAYISGYRMEHRFGFSNQNPAQFWGDEFKNLMLNLILSPLLALILFWSFSLSPEYWWLLAAAAMVLVSGIFATLYPLVILPLFNTYTPIRDENLTSRLAAILKKGGLKIRGFYLQDMSRQTKKENAFLGGLGRTRRVVLSDNIVQNMRTDELEVVIAHEVGHYRHRHILRNILISALFQLLIFYLTHRILLSVYPDYLSTFNARLAAFPLFILCFSLLNYLIVRPLMNAVSRHFERQADRYALESTGNADAFKRAMAGLANRNLSNAYPTPFIKWMYYSHPPVGERLVMAEGFGTDRTKKT